MTSSVFVVVMIGLSFVAFAVCSLIWAYSNGQFRDVEGVARRMMDLDQ